MNTNLTIQLHWTDERNVTQTPVIPNLVKTAGVAGSVLSDLRTVYIPSGGSLTLETTAISSGSFDLHIRVEALH